MPAPDSPAPERAALPGDEAAVTAAYPAPQPAATAPGSATATPAATDAAPHAAPHAAASPVTVETVRHVHLSEDWLATAVGLAIVTIGLLGLIPEGLVP